MYSVTKLCMEHAWKQAKSKTTLTLTSFYVRQLVAFAKKNTPPPAQFSWFGPWDLKFSPWEQGLNSFLTKTHEKEIHRLLSDTRTPAFKVIKYLICQCGR